MNVSVNGIGEVVITMKAEADVNLGDLVVMKESFNVKKAAAEEEPIGMCVSKNGEYAAVQIHGGMVVPCEDEGLTPGYAALKATSNGGVAKAESGINRLVVAVDTVSKNAEVIF